LRPDPQNHPSRILVVEDEQALRDLLVHVLSEDGFTVASAEDGIAALELLRKGKFDLVLLDIWMPRMNGLEVLATLKQKSEQNHTPLPKVIVVTADNTPETLLTSIREQAYQYVNKPFSTRSVLELVKRVLSGAPEAAAIEVISARPNWVELLLPCDHESAERIQSFMTTLGADLPEEMRQSVGQAFRELLLNAIEWGGGLDPSRKVRISYLRAERMLLYRIADPGPGFKFEGLTHAAVSNPPEDPVRHLVMREKKHIRAGGFGIMLTRASVDEVIYNEAQNEVVLVKYLD
jgi:CheY-like chemotaxis protein/anti-sigma regulatory factor (Ser/Thr protein kinase)